MMLNQIFYNSEEIVKFLIETFFVSLIVLIANFLYIVMGKQQAKTTLKTIDVPIVVAARFKIKPEKREEFIQSSLAIVEPTMAETGVISYSFYEDLNLKNHFIFFEEWKSREALEFHLKTPYLEKIMHKFPEFINGEPNIRIYEINKVDYKLPFTKS